MPKASPKPLCPRTLRAVARRLLTMRSEYIAFSDAIEALWMAADRLRDTATRLERSSKKRGRHA